MFGGGYEEAATTTLGVDSDEFSDGSDYDERQGSAAAVEASKFAVKENDTTGEGFTFRSGSLDTRLDAWARHLKLQCRAGVTSPAETACVSKLAEVAAVGKSGGLTVKGRILHHDHSNSKTDLRTEFSMGSCNLLYQETRRWGSASAAPSACPVVFSDMDVEGSELQQEPNHHATLTLEEHGAETTLFAHTFYGGAAANSDPSKQFFNTAAVDRVFGDIVVKSESDGSPADSNTKYQYVAQLLGWLGSFDEQLSEDDEATEVRGRSPAEILDDGGNATGAAAAEKLSRLRVGNPNHSGFTKRLQPWVEPAAL